MRVLILAALMMFGFAGVVAADYQFELDKAAIHVTTGFDGDHFSVYGTKKPAEDVVVVVRGPARHMKVRLKEKVMGGWINNASMVFDNVPSFYSVAATAPLLEIADEALLKSLKLGMERLDFTMHEGEVEEDYALYRAALMRNKSDEALLQAKLAEVQVLKDDFVRAKFVMPHNVTLGQYDVRMYYFENGRLSGQAAQQLEVKQVGVNARILKFAQGEPLLYGLLCVFLAVFAGWLSNRLKRVL